MKVTITGMLRSGLALLLVLCMAASMFPMAALAAEEELDSSMSQLMDLLKQNGFETEGTPVSGTVNYHKTDASYYVALGDGSAMTGDTEKDIPVSYVEKLAEQLGVAHKNLAVELNTVEAQVAQVQAGGEVAAEIAKADLITIGFGNVTFIADAVEAFLYDGKEVDWSKYAGEEEAAQIKRAIANVTREKLGTDNPKINYTLETFAYSCVSYAEELPVLVEEIRKLNPDAAVLVVGMYNPMDGVTMNLGEIQADLSGYINEMVNLVSLNSASYCAQNGTAVYVDARDVDTVNQSAVLDTRALADLAFTNCKALNPSEAGHTYIKDQIVDCFAVADRIYGANRVHTSLGIAEELKKVQGVEKFQTIILASGGSFADALAGSYLAYVKNAPILLVDSANVTTVKNYIAANLAEGGILYILGGTGAVSADVEIAMHNVTNKIERLYGKSRYDTNLKILEEAGVSGQDLLVCTGQAYADSLSAASAGLPILLVDGKSTGLTEAQTTYLHNTTIGNIYILGGTGAVSQGIEDDLEDYGKVERLSGKSRYETSVTIARKFFGDELETVVLAYGENYPDGLAGGPLAAALGAPIVLTRVSSATTADAYVKGISYGVILGGKGSAEKPLITDAAAMDIMEVVQINDQKFVG